MTDGFDIQKWIIIQQKAIDNDLKLKITGSVFLVTKKNTETLLGSFHDIYTLFSFLCGYEAGKAGR